MVITLNFKQFSFMHFHVFSPPLVAEARWARENCYWLCFPPRVSSTAVKNFRECREALLCLYLLLVEIEKLFLAQRLEATAFDVLPPHNWGWKARPPVDFREEQAIVLCAQHVNRNNQLHPSSAKFIKNLLCLPAGSTRHRSERKFKLIFRLSFVRVKSKSSHFVGTDGWLL